MKSHTFMISLFLMGLFLFAFSCSQKMTEEQMYAKAADLESKEQFDESVKMFERMVKTYPHGKKTEEALYRVGMMYASNLKDFEKSVNSFKKIVDDYPESELYTNALFMIGFRYANDIKDYDKAKEVYTEFLEKYPDHELASSVKWELDHLGQDISDIEFLGESSDSQTTDPGK